MELLFIGFIFLFAAITNDKSLVNAIRSGDQIAFKQLFDSFYKLLIRYVEARGLSETEADDLVQAAFIYIWENKEKLNPDLSLKAYMYRIIYSRMLNYLKRNERTDSIDKLELQLATDHTTEEQIQLNELNTVIKTCLNNMPEKRRMVFESCFINQLSYKETAQAFDISVNTVENHMQKALKFMREQVNIFMKK